jgi:hypothetical protein
VLWSEAFAKESSLSGYYVCLRIVKTSELLRERVALFTDERSLLSKTGSFCATRKVNPVYVLRLTTY